MTEITTPSRRQLLTLIGKVGGAAAMYQAMTALGHAAETQFTGPPVLTGAKPGASVVVLGAGLAGMVAAFELTKAGYSVKILEFQDRPGGRNYSLRGGDTFTESDGTVQKVRFAPGNYINPGPWRIPPGAVDFGLHLPLERGEPRETLQKSGRNGWPRRAGG